MNVNTRGSGWIFLGPILRLIINGRPVCLKSRASIIVSPQKMEFQETTEKMQAANTEFKSRCNLLLEGVTHKSKRATLSDNSHVWHTWWIEGKSFPISRLAPYVDHFEGQSTFSVQYLGMSRLVTIEVFGSHWLWKCIKAVKPRISVSRWRFPFADFGKNGHLDNVELIIMTGVYPQRYDEPWKANCCRDHAYEQNAQIVCKHILYKLVVV